ncbi:nose resistant to fluoxetine protein 6 [Penaeus vannamei]|uniref:nose resistant to fluoxetine protein 6 n=1 Tax=Penaeus vannamei TaxID=6689 RepID=UPI00387F5255
MVHVFLSPFVTLLFLPASSADVCGHAGAGRGVLQGLDFLGQEESSLDPSAVEEMMARTGQAAVREPGGQPWSLYLPVFADAASPCGLALAAMASALEGNASLGVLQMVDSWGKLRDGYLHGTPLVLGLGSFSECIHAHSPALGIKGRYCSVFSLDNKTQLPPDADAKLRLAQASAGVDVGLFTQYGTCIPDACTEADMEESLHIALDGRKKVIVACQALDEAPQFTGEDIAMISFLSVVLAVMAIGTAVDVYCRTTTSTPNLGVRFLLPFSPYTNLEKMFHVTTESRPGVISCLHGMRVLSMTWVIIGHQYVSLIIFSKNLVSLQTLRSQHYTEDDIRNKSTRKALKQSACRLGLRYRLFPKQTQKSSSCSHCMKDEVSVKGYATCLRAPPDSEQTTLLNINFDPAIFTSGIQQNSSASSGLAVVVLLPLS